MLKILVFFGIIFTGLYNNIVRTQQNPFETAVEQQVRDQMARVLEIPGLCDQYNSLYYPDYNGQGIRRALVERIEIADLLIKTCQNRATVDIARRLREQAAKTIGMGS